MDQQMERPASSDPVRRSDFGDDFVWGVASASYQIEGGWDLDGKSPSVWDTFVHNDRRWPLPSKVKDHTTADVSCDFYHRYDEDLALAGAMGFGVKRFSISWPRILPEGSGRVNAAGLDFYDRVVDSCLAHGLDPWVTLYHWDMPQCVNDRGGWTSRRTVDEFAEYCGVVAERLGDRVKNWMIFNEPASFLLLGYLLGFHAPGRRSLNGFVAASHHVALAQAKGAAAIRAVTDGKVGTTHYFAPIRNTGDSPRHRRAQRRTDALLNRMFIEPNLGLGYPMDDLPLLRRVEAFMLSGDDKAIEVDFDFMGAQYYTRLVAPPLPLPLLGTIPMPGKDLAKDDVCTLGWQLQPDGLFEVLERLHGYGRFDEIVITENGMAVPDHVEGGRVRDARRIDSYRRHLSEARRAVRAGIPVTGYLCWCLTDNFEWADGYRSRFGLVHVDFDTQQRTIKDSGWEFQDFLTRGAAYGE